MPYRRQTRSQGFQHGGDVRPSSLDSPKTVDTLGVRCCINIRYKQSMNIIGGAVPLEITIHQLEHVYKVEHLKQELWKKLSKLKCFLSVLPRHPNHLIVAEVEGGGRINTAGSEQLKNNIVQILNTFSGYCKECTVTQETIKILGYSDFLYTEIAKRGKKVDIVYYEGDYIEWLLDLKNCSEGQKQHLISLIMDVEPKNHKFYGNEMVIWTNPLKTDRIQDICRNFDTYVKNNDGYVKIHHCIHIHGNDSKDQPTLGPKTDPDVGYVNNNPKGPSMSNTEPEDRYAHQNSQGQSMACQNTEPGNMTIHNNTNVLGTTLFKTSGGAVPGAVHNNVRHVNSPKIIPGRAVQVDDSWSVIDHSENGQYAEFGGNTGTKKDNGTGTHKEDKHSPTSPDTMNDMKRDMYDLKHIDLIYLDLFNKRNQIQDKILQCFSHLGYNQLLTFNEDGSTEPPLNNDDFFVLNVAINKFLDIKTVLIEQYDLPDNWVNSVNITENNIVVEQREPYILIVGLKDIVIRVLVNLHQYIREADVSTKALQQIETNQDSYHIGINCPLDCEYICKAGDQLLRELQKKYRRVIDIQPLITGTKEIYLANWTHESRGAGFNIEIPLVIGNYRTLPNQSDMLVMTQNQMDQYNGYREEINGWMTLFNCKTGQADYMNLQKVTDSSKVKHLAADLEECVKSKGYKTLILLMDKTTQKETISVFLKACKTSTKEIYLPIESRSQINRDICKNLFDKGTLEYGGQGHLFEIKIGQTKDQKVDVIVDVVESQTLGYTLKETKATVGAHQYRFRLNIPQYSSDSSNPMINLSYLVMKCLRRASKKKMTSIAIPVLGVGSLGYPVKLVARSMIETIDEYFRSQNETSLCQVMIVIEHNDTSSKKAFFRENLARIKEGRIAGDTVYKVEIKVAGDKSDNRRIENEINDIITKKEVVFNDISDPIREVRMAADRVDEVNKKLTGDKTESRTTERDLERPVMVARERSTIERERSTTERETKDKTSGGKAPVVGTTRTNSEGNMNDFRKLAFDRRDVTHEPRCVIIELTARDAGFANTQNVLISILKENKPLCVVSPYQDDIYRAFLSFGSKRSKDEACSVIKKMYRNSKFIDIPASEEVVTPLINRVNIHIKDCNDLKQDLVEASGVNTISNNGEVFIEGCPQQIELAKTMLETKYSLKRRNQNIESISEHVEPHSVKTYKFRALEYLFGKDKMIKICRDVKEADGETHFTLPKDSKNKLVEDLKELMYRTIRHEEIDVTDDKIEEAKRYSTNHAHMDTVYVEFDTKINSIHILGEDYEDVEFVSYQAKVAVGIIKLTNKKQQRTRTDEYTLTPPPVKLAPSEIQERIFYTKCKNLTVHVKKSDITILDVDVIVNAANGMMMHGGGVARFIATAGGDELDRQCRRYIDDNGHLPITGICKTTGGNLRCKQVYHAVGPCWSDYSNKWDCEDDLCKTIVRCLVEADQDGFQSIAIPSISSAIFGVPKNICVHMYAKAVKSFDAVHPVSNLREIYFVDVIDAMVSMVQTGFDMFFTQGDDDELIKEEIERFIKEITCKDAEKQPEEGITDKKSPEFSMIAVTKEVDNKPYITCSLQSIITLHIYQASVLSTKTDSITTWEDSAMTDFKASAKKIINAAGDVYKEERSKLKSGAGFKTRSVIRTSAGCLQYQNIYHLLSSINPGWVELDVLLDNLVKENSMTTDASITIDIGDVDADALFTSLVNMFKTAKPSTLKEIHLVAESDDKIKKLQSNYGDYIKQLGGIVKTSNINCSICLDEITDIKALPCGHTFCAECVDESIEKNPVCPISRSNAYDEIQTGNQPDGKMAHSILHTHLEGFPHRDTIEIVYTFPDGIQSANHPRPGYPYKGKTETAYLPDNMKGREILKLLKLAFDRRLIFTVSPDVTASSEREFVTWNNIPHKTRKDGGPESNGYPDPDYLPQVKRALYTRGVEIERQDATGEVDRIENFRDGDELIEVLQRYQNIEITVKTELLIKLSGTIINHDDLVLSLNVKEWLHDTIIDAYLSLLSEDEKQHGNNIYVIPTCIAKLMLSEQYDQCMSSLENVKLDEYTWVFIPVNTHNHWVLLAANIKQGRVSLLDSLHDGNTDVVLKWSKFMNYRGEKTGELNIDWVECNDWVSSKQRDLASCGPFVLLNALAISRNIKPQCFNTEHAKLMRKLVTTKLLKKGSLVTVNS